MNVKRWKIRPSASFEALHVGFRGDVAERVPALSLEDPGQHGLGFLGLAPDQVVVGHAVALGGDVGGVAGGQVEQRFRWQQSLVHQQPAVVAVVFQQIHLRRDPLKQCGGFVLAAQPHQAHPHPVGGRDDGIVVVRNPQRFLVGGQCAGVIALQEAGEAEVVPDVVGQRGPRDAGGIGRAVGFDLVRLAGDQFRGVFEVALRMHEVAGGDVAMATMAVQARVVRPACDALVEHGDRLLVAPQVAESTRDPDQCVGIVRMRGEVRAGSGQVGFQRVLVRHRIGRVQRFPGQRRDRWDSGLHRVGLWLVVGGRGIAAGDQHEQQDRGGKSDGAHVGSPVDAAW